MTDEDHAKEAHKRASTKKKKKAKKKHHASEAHHEEEHHEAPSKKDGSSSPEEYGEVESISLDKLLAVFLAVSLILNFYLFFQYNSLSNQLEEAKSGLMTNPGGIEVSGGQAIPKGPSTTSPKATGDTAKLDFYVMSQCPFGVQVLNAIEPVLDKVGDDVDFSINYIADESGDGFRALHGQPEVDENIRQLCTIKYYPNNYQYLDYIVCRNQNIRSTAWEECASSNNMDVSKIKACAESDEGKELHRASLNVAKQAQATGSPTIYLNGEKYGGARSPDDFMKAICRELGNKPASCADLPADVEVDIIILNDKRCVECDTSMLEDRLKQEFPGGKFVKRDYATAVGKKLYQDTKVQYLPAILFTEDVKKASGYGRLSRYMIPSGDYLSLRVGASFDPTAEICDNEMDDTNNGKIDCDDPTCTEKMICRKEVDKKLEVFVMSECPYGIRALDAMEEVLDAVDLDFSVHFIASYDKATDKFNSLHGQAEVDEDIRQLCTIKYYPDDYKFMDYIWCRNKNIKGPWKSCAESSGLDATKIESCATSDEGKNLLIEDSQKGIDLGVSGSPTWLANNKYKFSGLAAEQIKSQFCQYNKGLAGCEKTLSDDTGGAPATGGCG